MAKNPHFSKVEENNYNFGEVINLTILVRLLYKLHIPAVCKINNA